MNRQILCSLLVSLGLLLAGCDVREPDNSQTQARANELRIENGWVRETPPGAKVAAAFFTINNVTDTDVRLTGANFDLIGRSEIHSMRMQDGMMRMRQLTHLEIRAGSQHQLSPGSDHMMLFDLQQAMRAGMRIKGTLQFADGRELAIELPVLASAPSDNAAH